MTGEVGVLAAKKFVPFRSWFSARAQVPVRGVLMSSTPVARWPAQCRPFAIPVPPTQCGGGAAVGPAIRREFRRAGSSPKSRPAEPVPFCSTGGNARPLGDILTVINHHGVIHPIDRSLVLTGVQVEPEKLGWRLRLH